MEPYRLVRRMAPPSRLAAGLLLVVIAVAGASCGADRSAEPPERTSAAAAAPEASGSAGFSAHREVIDEYLACLRAEDIDVRGAWRVPDGGLFYVAAAGPIGGALEEELEACYTADIAAVDREFQLSLPPDGDPEALPETIQAEVVADAPLDCLGLEGDEHVSDLAREWEHNQEQYIDCLVGS